MRAHSLTHVSHSVGQAVYCPSIPPKAAVTSRAGGFDCEFGVVYMYDTA